MEVPKRTMTRKVLLENMEWNVAYTLDDVAELLYGDTTWFLRTSARHVVEGAVQHGLVRQLVSGRYKITAYGRIFLGQYWR